MLLNNIYKTLTLFQKKEANIQSQLQLPKSEFPSHSSLVTDPLITIANHLLTSANHLLASAK